MRISHDAITGPDPKRRIVLAGMPGLGDITAWDFLNNLYRAPGFAEDFDVAALHPYGLEHRPVARSGRAGPRRDGPRTAMRSKPMWLTEIGWGSGPRTGSGSARARSARRRLLTGAFKLILNNREAWNVQRVFWFDWRDPSNAEAGKCSFCATAGPAQLRPQPKARLLRLQAVRQCPLSRAEPRRRIV